MTRVAGARRLPARLASALVLATTLCSALGLVPSAGGASTPGLSLAVNPVRLELAGKARAAFAVTNPTRRLLVVDASTADFVLRPNGTAVVSPKLPSARSAKKWLTVSPAKLRLAPGATATLRVSSSAPKGASPGDHHALVQFTTAPARSGTVRTRTQIGLPVLVRVDGPLLRKLEIRSLRAVQSKGKRSLRLVLRNHGNINERMPARSVTVTLNRARDRVARLVASARSILPGESIAYTLALPKAVHGSVAAVVHVRPASANAAGPGAPRLEALTKSFRLRLAAAR